MVLLIMKELEEDKRREAQAGGYASLNALEPQGAIPCYKNVQFSPPKNGAATYCSRSRKMWSMRKVCEYWRRPSGAKRQPVNRYAAYACYFLPAQQNISQV